MYCTGEDCEIMYLGMICGFQTENTMVISMFSKIP
jgi:hypothetical protein